MRIRKKNTRSKNRKMRVHSHKRRQNIMKGGNIQPKPFVDSPLNYSNIKTWPGVSTSHGGNHYEYNEYNNDPQLQMKYEGFVGGYVWNKKRRSKKNKKNKNSTRGKSSNRQYLGGGAFPIISDAALYLKSGMNSIGNIPKILTGNPVNPSVMPWNGQFKQFLNK